MSSCIIENLNWIKKIVLAYYRDYKIKKKREKKSLAEKNEWLTDGWTRWIIEIASLLKYINGALGKPQFFLNGRAIEALKKLFFP